MPQTVTHELEARHVRPGDTFRGEQVQDVQTKVKYTHIRLPVSTVVKPKDEVVTVHREEKTEEEKTAELREYTVRRLRHNLNLLDDPFRSYGETFASGEATPSDIESYVKLQAKVYYWGWIKRRVEEDQEDIFEAAQTALRQAIRDVVAGPDDTWSGRQNDVARIKHQGARDFVSELIWAGVTTGSEDLDKLASRIH